MFRSQSVGSTWSDAALRSAVLDRDAHEQVVRARLRVFHEDVEVAVVVEDAGVEELPLGLGPPAPRVLLDEPCVGVLPLRVLVEGPQVGMGRRRVEVEVALLDVLAVVPLGPREAEEPLLEDGVALVPEGQGQAEPLMVVRDPEEPILPPPVGARPGMVVGEVLPHRPAGRVVLADRAPLTLGEIRPPPLPVGRPGPRLGEPPRLGRHPSVSRHGRTPDRGSCPRRRTGLAVDVVGVVHGPGHERRLALERPVPPDGDWSSSEFVDPRACRSRRPDAPPRLGPDTPGDATPRRASLGTRRQRTHARGYHWSLTPGRARLILHAPSRRPTSPMSILIRDATVITVDPQRRILDPGAVYVEGARIVDVGRSEEVVAPAPGGDTRRRRPAQGRHAGLRRAPTRTSATRSSGASRGRRPRLRDRPVLPDDYGRHA